MCDENHPLQLNGVMHAPDCAVWFTPPCTVVRSKCDCQAPLVFVPPNLYDAARCAGYDLEFYRRTHPIPNATERKRSRAR